MLSVIWLQIKMDDQAQCIRWQILDGVASSVNDLHLKLTDERQNRLDLQGEQRYLDNIHLTLLKIINTIKELRDITDFKEIKNETL